MYSVRASQVAQCVKSLAARRETQETWVLSVGHEDPLEEGLATHSSTLAWRIPQRAWWTTVPRVTKSQTQLKKLSKHTCFITEVAKPNFGRNSSQYLRDQTGDFERHLINIFRLSQLLSHPAFPEHPVNFQTVQFQESLIPCGRKIYEPVESKC